MFDTKQFFISWWAYTFEEELENGNIACDKDEFAANMNFYETKIWMELQAEA